MLHELAMGTLLCLGWKLAHACRATTRTPPQWTPPAIKPHRCIDADAITRAGDGVLRCKECYIKERRRATFCGEDWPLLSEARVEVRPQAQAVADVWLLPRSKDTQAL